MYEVVKVKKHTSRQQHPCYYCHQSIDSRTKYVNVTKRGDNRLFSDHFHIECYQNIDYNVNFFTKEMSKLAAEIDELKLTIHSVSEQLEKALHTDMIDERDVYQALEHLQNKVY